MLDPNARFLHGSTMSHVTRMTVTGMLGLTFMFVVDLANLFLNEAKVVTVPGDGFGAPGHIRFSYPMASDVIREGINRVRKILEELN